MTTSRIHVALAALMGACGVALWAFATHRKGAGSLEIAAQLLLFHCTAVIAITACRKLGLLANRVSSIALSMMILGNVLFASAPIFRSFAGFWLFPIAAPIGGSMIILSWLGVALSVLLSMKDRGPPQ
jgi:uncharacterized membrane protein YgdD (TMEM256/DUF423 family)